MTFQLVILGAPRTKKTSNRLGWRHSRKLGRKVRVVLPSRAWARWTKSAVIIEADSDGVWIRTGRGRPEVLHGTVLLGLHPLTTANVRCAAKFYRHANVGDAVGFYQGLADLLEKRGDRAHRAGKPCRDRPGDRGCAHRAAE